jgi:hypothetical protein
LTGLSRLAVTILWPTVLETTGLTRCFYSEARSDVAKAEAAMWSIVSGVEWGRLELYMSIWPTLISARDMKTMGACDSAVYNKAETQTEIKTRRVWCATWRFSQAESERRNRTNGSETVPWAASNALTTCRCRRLLCDVVPPGTTHEGRASCRKSAVRTLAHCKPLMSSKSDRPNL